MAESMTQILPSKDDIKLDANRSKIITSTGNSKVSKNIEEEIDKAM
jgi:hypothetical protein